MKILINPKYKEVISVTQEDYNLLKQSIKENGQFQPIIINEEGTILDGHLRYQACTELNIEPKFLIKQFDNILEEKRFVILSNLSRRNLNNYQKAKLLYLLEPIESKLAEQRMLKGTLASNEARGKTSHKVTKNRNISASTYERAKYVMEHGSKELQAQCESGEISVNSACTELKKESSQYKESQLKNEHNIFLNRQNFISELKCTNLEEIKNVLSKCKIEIETLAKKLSNNNLNLLADEIFVTATPLTELLNKLNIESE